jgi:hypothetical protein
VWRGYLCDLCCRGLQRHTLLTGLWSTQVKVEGKVRKPECHSSSNSSTVNDPTGEPGRTPIYVCLPHAWGSVDGEHMSSFCFVEELLNLGLREIRKNE